MGLHSPEIKAVAKQLSREGGEVVLSDEIHQIYINGAEVIRAFEAVRLGYLKHSKRYLRL